jgi:hypothetical protein
MARNMLACTSRDAVVGNEYVATGIATLRGQEVGRAEIRVPAIAVDPTVVGEAEVTNLKSALEVAVQAVAKANARAAGH